MTEEQNTIALNKARDYSDNKDKVDGFYNGYVQATKELQEELEQAKKVKVVEHFEAYGQCRDSRRIANLEAQIEKMKSDVRDLITDRMNDDLDQNIIEHLFEKWELAE